MTDSIKHLQIETLKHQLSLFKTVYEEMISNEKEFEDVKPLLLQIRKIEKAIGKISSEQESSKPLDISKVNKAMISHNWAVLLFKYLST